MTQSISDYNFNSTPSSNQGELINEIPLEIFLEIISYLPAHDLASCESVCFGWKTTIADSRIWFSLLLSKYGRHKVESCDALIKQLGLSWKQAYRYCPLLIFLVQANEECGGNPEIVHGDKRFYITCEGSVESKPAETSSGEISSFDGMEGCRAIKIALEDDFLFALADTGQIFKWDWRTREYLNCFSTNLSEKNAMIRLKNISTFFVQDGLIILRRRNSSTVEVINHSDEKGKSKLLNDEKFASADILIKKGNDLWLHCISATEANMITVFDLSTEQLGCQLRLDVSLSVDGFELHGDRLFVFGEYEDDEDTSGCIYIINNKGKVEKTLVFKDYRFHQVFVQGNLVMGAEFGLQSEKEEDNYTRLVVVDLEKEEVVKVINRLQKKEMHSINESEVGDLLQFVSNYCP